MGGVSALGIINIYMSATLSLSLPTLPHRHPNPDYQKQGPATTTTSSSSNTDPTTAYLNARLAPLAARELEEETAGTVKVDAGRIAAAAFVDTGMFHRWARLGCWGVGGVCVSVRMGDGPHAHAHLYTYIPI